MKISANILYYFATFAFVPIAIAFVAGWLKFNPKSKERWIFALVGIACLSEIISSWLWRNQLNNILISHIYVVVEFTALFAYFMEFLGTSEKKYNYIPPLLFALFVGGYVFLWNDPFQMNAVPRTVESIIMIALTLFTYRHVMKNSGAENLWNFPLFWINSAVLIYFSSNLLLFYFSSYIATVTNGLSGWIWTVHLVFMTIYYSLISIGLWKTPQTQH